VGVEKTMKEPVTAKDLDKHFFVEDEVMAEWSKRLKSKKPIIIVIDEGQSCCGMSAASLMMAEKWAEMMDNTKKQMMKRMDIRDLKPGVKK